MHNFLDDPRHSRIIFDPVKHTYYFDLTEKFVGITGWIGQYKQPFRKFVIAQAVARRDGKTQDEVLAEWDQKRDDSADYGNFAHEAIERWVKGQRLRKGQKEYVDLVKPLFKENNLTPIAAEIVVYNEDLRRASPIDVLCVDNEGYLVVVDIKTYEKGVEWSGYKDNMMLYPIHNLPDSNFYHTSLQTGLYIKWIKEKYGVEKIREYGYILHLRPPQCSLLKTNDTSKEIALLYEQDKAISKESF